MSATHISNIILRLENVKDDWKLNRLPVEKNNGRKVLVNGIYPNSENHIMSPEWKAGTEAGKTPVMETGEGGIEVATFTEAAWQDCHKHLLATEIYTVLEGTMRMKVDEANTPVVLNAGDEIIILPNTAHEVVTGGASFLTRVHAINCFGEKDKYVKRNGEWQAVVKHK